MSPEDNNTSPAPISISFPSLIAPPARVPGALSPRPLLAPRAMYQISFLPRPFPPPALADVPLEYIVHQLRRLAPYYWSRPETSDCTILVSLDNEHTNKLPASAAVCDAFGNLDINSEEASVLGDGFASAGRNTARKPMRPRRMIMKLHMDYLCAHSALFRGLLSGASPFDLAIDTETRHKSAPSPSMPRQSSSIRYPSILPSSTCTHPVIHLPIPDPPSFHHLVHYLYFGSTSFMEEALDKGELTWEGLARNVEYLQMDSEVKLFLGRYWRSTNVCHHDDSGSSREREYDSDCDEDAYMSDDSTLADLNEDHMCLADDEDDDDLIILKAKARARARDPPRGRQRTTRRLGHSTSDPIISHRAAEAGPSTFRRNTSK